MFLSSTYLKQSSNNVTWNHSHTVQNQLFSVIHDLMGEYKNNSPTNAFWFNFFNTLACHYF